MTDLIELLLEPIFDSLLEQAAVRVCCGIAQWVKSK
jgi:hypothetical protein